MYLNCVDKMQLTKYLCHRIPERSFFIKGHQFPVCARCTGFYTGLAVYLIWNHFYGHAYDINTLILSMILMIPVAADGFTQYFGPRESTNSLRFITGFIGGIGLIIFLKIIFRWILYVLF
ncbi:DUF2085 domain-containing protein [Methanobrevibacter sp.]|uniref:DUF2085 domain-containing protein n=1 Tax=Methanobrevibacter sp. TaxID=66852 RepID=UPI00388ECBB3